MPIDTAFDSRPAPHPSRPTLRFMLSHPAHLIALGFGAGLSPFAAGTVGTLWAWVAYWVMQRYGMTEPGWALLVAASLPVGWWASTLTARHLQVLDPGCIVWDEIAAFWLVLWLVMPVGLMGQLVAFGLFRYFDAAKPGPVGWADRLFHGVTPDVDRRAWQKAGFGVMLDDLVAAGCTLLVIAAWRFF